VAKDQSGRDRRGDWGQIAIFAPVGRLDWWSWTRSTSRAINRTRRLDITVGMWRSSGTISRSALRFGQRDAIAGESAQLPDEEGDLHAGTTAEAVMDLPMPQMRLVDMRESTLKRHPLDLLSEPIVENLGQTLARNEQAILLLNRRGYSNFVFCSSCKHTLRCRNCDASLTFHKTPTTHMTTVTGRHMEHGYAMCHYCMAQTLVPRDCPVCGKRMTMIGVGSQRLEEELARRFPQARVARVDSDSMASQDYYSLLKEFAGAISISSRARRSWRRACTSRTLRSWAWSAPIRACICRLRANERTFQLIAQVAGRAGRSEKRGVVFVQTYFPEQPRSSSRWRKISTASCARR